MKTFFSRVRAPFLLAAIPLFTLYSSAVTVLIMAPFMPRERCDRWIRFWARGVLRLAGVKVKVTGLENLEGLKAAILVSNHLSHFDIPVLFAAVPLSFRMVAKAELFKIPLFGRALSALGFVPVVRETSSEASKTVQAVRKKFENGESIWIAPEGTRQTKPAIGQFKSGAFHIAMKTGAPVVPICIYGTQEILPKGSLLVNRDKWQREVYVNVLPPVRAENKLADSRVALRDCVRSAMVEEFSKLHTASGARDLTS